MSIDWSKAPEGATHWQPQSENLHESWIKFESGRYWFSLPSQNAWTLYRGPHSWMADIQARPAEWSGNGLPPVGTVCEYNDLKNPQWIRVVILAHFNNRVPVAVFIPDNESQNRTVDQAIAECFRPVRTAEQIAAEERQRAIENLGEWLSESCSIPTPYLWEAAQKIYDAGYRKQEKS